MSLPDDPRPAPPRSWWRRNWKWTGRAGCLSILVMIALFAGSIVLLVLTLMRHTDVFREAVARAEANPQVRAELGEPIREGWWVSGHVRTTGSSGNAALAIPLKGSQRDGTVYAVAHKSEGRWRYATLEVALEGRPGRISLLVEGDSW
ncbi:MAG: cytochrome c oxidase assembly factor Coa1 family protein [Thermoanaerobaculia bacterium]